MALFGRRLKALRKKREAPATEPWVREQVAAGGGGSGSVAWADVTGKPSTFTPSAHTHPASEISDAGATGRSLLQAATAAIATAILNTFTSALKGLVPPSGGGTTSFLRADGSWAAPVVAGNAGVATLDFGTYGEDATVTVTGQTGILVGSSVIASIAATDTAENTIDDIFIDPPQVLVGNIVAGTGFTIYGRAIEGGLHGRINVNWNWR